LRYFIAVAEELNFSRAAERLHVSQPPLSRQIRDLEAELKVKLLDRNTQGVRLTRVGHAVLARSRNFDALRTQQAFASSLTAAAVGHNLAMADQRSPRPLFEYIMMFGSDQQTKPIAA
jgi:DNA-binding transcriptional LysR family regulator